MHDVVRGQEWDNIQAKLASLASPCRKVKRMEQWRYPGDLKANHLAAAPVAQSAASDAGTHSTTSPALTARASWGVPLAYGVDKVVLENYLAQCTII